MYLEERNNSSCPMFGSCPSWFLVIREKQKFKQQWAVKGTWGQIVAGNNYELELSWSCNDRILGLKGLCFQRRTCDDTYLSVIGFVPRKNTVRPRLAPYAEFSGEIRSVFIEHWFFYVPLLYRPFHPGRCTQNSGCWQKSSRSQEFKGSRESCPPMWY